MKMTLTKGKHNDTGWLDTEMYDKFIVNLYANFNPEVILEL